MQNRHYEIWPKNLPYSLSQKECSVYDNLINSAEKVPDRIAIKFYGKELTYREVIEQVKC